MKYFCTAIMALVFSAAAHAELCDSNCLPDDFYMNPAPTRCKSKVEKQNPELAREAGAKHEKKPNLIEEIEQGETSLKGKKAKKVIRLLKRKDTVAYSFSNKDAAWLSIANSKTCKVILTTHLGEF